MTETTQKQKDDERLDRLLGFQSFGVMHLASIEAMMAVERGIDQGTARRNFMLQVGEVFDEAYVAMKPDPLADIA